MSAHEPALRRLVITAGPLSRVALVIFALALAIGLVGCGDDPQPQNKPSSAKPAAAAPAKKGKGKGKAAEVKLDLPPLPLKEFKEGDFSETDQSRDPFRSFASVFVSQAKAKATVQRKAIVERYALDELKLIGIVSRGTSRALLTDPSGSGWVAKVGDLIGKPELVHSGGPTGIDVALNWRVDRIRSNDVVFVREDPSHPEIPPTTRVIALRSPEEEQNLLMMLQPQR
ncbi:MAG TPA: pilus assembly protein PilP [Byssovorax sp.]|jgi:type IV pilus assembly protein PilP